MRGEWFFLVAFVLYTGAILSHRLKGILRLWMVMMFAFAFIADMVGTAICFKAKDGFSISPHSILGLLALLVMAVHMSWAILTYTGATIRAEELFRAYAPVAWLLWVLSLISGIPFMHA
jgi:uncharacterized repeat protein (TIGR03987 family)